MNIREEGTREEVGTKSSNILYHYRQGWPYEPFSKEISSDTKLDL